jgi:hypothetical protein
MNSWKLEGFTKYQSASPTDDLSPRLLDEVAITAGRQQGAAQRPVTVVLNWEQGLRK